jgi:hypothetical protein
MHAGDRSDADIRGLTEGAFALRPDFVVAAENPKYLRGRTTGEVTALIRQACVDQGLDPAHLILADTPSAGAAEILARVGPGDLALLLVHAERAEIFALISAAQGAPG